MGNTLKKEVEVKKEKVPDRVSQMTEEELMTNLEKEIDTKIKVYETDIYLKSRIASEYAYRNQIEDTTRHYIPTKKINNILKKYNKPYTISWDIVTGFHIQFVVFPDNTV